MARRGSVGPQRLGQRLKGLTLASHGGYVYADALGCARSKQGGKRQAWCPRIGEGGGTCNRPARLDGPHTSDGESRSGAEQLGFKPHHTMLASAQGSIASMARRPGSIEGWGTRCSLRGSMKKARRSEDVSVRRRAEVVGDVGPAPDVMAQQLPWAASVFAANPRTTYPRSLLPLFTTPDVSGGAIGEKFPRNG
jgi:hypothetical protein